MSNSEISVIFSYWTTSLDAVECALEDNRVGYVRFDGQTSSGNRKMALRRLHNDPSVRVMLITVGCGAVGYGPLITFCLPTFY